MILQDLKLQKMFIRKNVGESRKMLYCRIFTKIYNITGLTPTEIIEIAKDEQKPKIIDNSIEFKDLEDRTITNIQYQFYNYLVEQGLKPESIKTEIAAYRAFLNEYNVQIPKNIQITVPQPLYETGDLPNKKHILQAIESTNNKRNKALIYFMSSSGIRPSDVRNLKISDFLHSCKYYLEDDLTLDHLFNCDYNSIIPCFYFRPLKTQKTNNICCTFCTPEATNSIIEYLQTRNIKSYDEYLFSTKDGAKIAPTSFTTTFQRINDKEFGLNKYGDRFFKAKHLRKYFITTCNQHSGDLLKVRLLAGHSLSDIDRAYNEINLNIMRRFYTKLIPYLSIHDTKIRDVKSKEYQELEFKLKKQEKENRKLKEELDEKISNVVHTILSEYK